MSPRYSQNDEQDVILELLQDMPTGRLLDIGAFDGKTFSNSLALIEKGWSAVLVEPNPTSLCSLINLHGSNDNVEIVGALVVGRSNFGLQKFFTCNDAVSTTDEQFTRLWTRAGVKFNPIWMPTVHPGEVIQGRKFDFFTIDVEDGTLELVEQMKLDLDRARVVCVEHTVGPNTIRQELREIFEKELKFSLVHQTGENYIFAKNVGSSHERR